MVRGGEFSFLLEQRPRLAPGLGAHVVAGGVEEHGLPAALPHQPPALRSWSGRARRCRRRRGTRVARRPSTPAASASAASVSSQVAASSFHVLPYLRRVQRLAYGGVPPRLGVQAGPPVNLALVYPPRLLRLAHPADEGCQVSERHASGLLRNSPGRRRCNFRWRSSRTSCSQESRRG